MRCPTCHRRAGDTVGCPLHGGVAGAATEGAAAEAAPRVAGFEGLRLLDEGGFARVFAAVRREDGRAVALKIARHRADPRFLREAAALGRIGPPTVPLLLGAGESEGGFPYLALELLEGETLARWMEALPGSGAAAPVEAARLLRALGAAVDRGHAAGVVHRDLKPENVVLRRPGAQAPDGARAPDVALLDFGLARLCAGRGATGEGEGAQPTQPGIRLGSVLYMAPEQCLDARDVDARADLYSLGVIAFELFTGRPPFVGEASAVVHAHVAQRPPRPSEIAPVPRGADEVLLRALAKAREERFASARAFCEALQAALAGATAPSPRQAVDPGLQGAASPRQGAASPRQGAASPRQGAASPRQDTVALQDTAASGRGPPRRSPVALVAVRGSAPMDRVAGVAASFGGRLARVQDGIYVIAFPGPARLRARAAFQAAQRLVAALDDVTSAAVHVAELHAREGAGGMVFAGAALARPADFWSPGAPGPVAVTPEAAALLDEGAEAAALLDHAAEAAPSASSAALETPAIALPLRGRDELVAEIVADARAALRGGAPLLFTLLGEVGHGKTRLCEAVTAALSAEPGVRAIAVAARPPDLAEPAGLARALLRAGLAVDPGAAADALRDACVARLGPELGLAAWPAVAFALDALPETEPAVAAVLAAPGALRQTLARAAGEALQRLARERPLALVVDDAQWGDQGGLDAIEIATLAGARAPLAVIVAAHPALAAARPLLGERAARARQRTLPPLDAGAARALLLDRLHPVEFAPEPVVASLLGAAQGVPLFLVDLAAALRQAGAIRKARGGPGWYLAGDEIAQDEAAPVMSRLARRALAGLPPPLAELAEVCALAGDELAIDEIGRLLDEAARERAVEACADLDPGVGLSRLLRRGLLRAADGGRLAFAHPLLRRAIEAEVPAAKRRRLHGIALRGLLAAPREGGAALARIARHAAAAGAHAEAAAACFELAEEARRRHLYVDAERHYTAALAALAETERAGAAPADAAAAPAGIAPALRGRVSRGAALAGRGKVRYRIQRFDDAADDLRGARAIAEARGDDARVVDLLLEEATILDWCDDFAGSQALVDRAVRLAERRADPGLDVRCDVALGRGHFRRQELEDAIARLAPAARRAEALGDHESQVIALLLVAPALVYAGRFEEAEARFDEVIARCERVGDRLHLGGAYMNRLTIRLMREDPEGAENDLRTAVALARELGNAYLERGPAHNLAELLYWGGELTEALPLALRALELQQRFFEASAMPDYALLVARIQCARGELAEARRHLDWVRTRCDLGAAPPVTRVLVRLCAQVVGGAGATAEAWGALVTEVREAALLSEHIEVLCFAAAAALESGRREDARRFLGEAAQKTWGTRFWKGRLSRLSAQLDGRAHP
ncbi:protein kinase domain-containing protein [Sorangium sp. So ce1000]|uniref:serine/threonine-protein kinase n=1 Tax=Sorangium sp. So ce1000 TaxID=3133325 RepID=UPI003F627A27